MAETITTEQQRLEGTALMLQWLAATEHQVRRMYADLYALSASVGFLPEKTVAEYNALRDRYVNMAKPVVDQVNDDARAAGRPTQPLNIPPRLDFAAGQAVQVPVGALAGAGDVVVPAISLVPAAALRLSVPETPSQTTPSGLGIPVAAWELAKTTAVILGVVVVVYLLAPVISQLLTTIGGFTGLSQMQAEAKSKADMVGALRTLSASCMDVAKTPEEKAKCMAAATAAVEAASRAAVKPRWSVAQWFSLFAAVAVVGGGSYFAYRYVSKRQRRPERARLRPAAAY